MPETKNQNNRPQTYKLKKKFWPGLYLRFLSGANILLNFFSLRRTKRFWGIVYDSVSKQPLDPVIVKLLYTDGREIETCVTDLGGAYGFLAKPGKFKIYARKTNYIFPSLFAPGSSDGIYQNLYHGEFFTLSETSEVVAPNIPMDPEKFDWNQQAKKKLIITHPHLELLFKKLIAVFFWYILALCAIYAWQWYPIIPFYLYAVFAAYLFLIILAKATREPRLWGKMLITNANLQPERLFLELHSALFPQVSFGKAQVHDNGRFLLRAGKGNYVLSISQIGDRQEKVFLASLPVKVGRAGVFNSTLEILGKNTLGVV